MGYTTLGTITTDNGGSYYSYVTGSSLNLNQSFKPSTSGTDTVNSFQWYGKTTGTVDIYLKNSSGTTLASTTDNESSVGWHTITFGYETVSPSSTYYIVFTPRTSVAVYMYYASRSSTYSNGTGYQGTTTGIGGTDKGYDFAIKITCYESYTTPTVTTTAASSIAETSATTGGNVTSDGGATVSARGVVWGTSSGSYPNTVTSGSGTGTFTANISGLSAGTNYYFKAYATNADGTSYGSEARIE